MRILLLFLPENLTISTAKYVDILARTLLQFNVERTHIAVYDVLDAPKTKNTRERNLEVEFFFKQRVAYANDDG